MLWNGPNHRVDVRQKLQTSRRKLRLLHKESFGLCVNTNWDAFVSVMILSQNWTGIRLQSVWLLPSRLKTWLWRYSRFVFLPVQQTHEPSREVELNLSALYIHVPTRCDTDAGVCPPSVTRYLTLKQTAKGQKGLWPSFSSVLLLLHWRLRKDNTRVNPKALVKSREKSCPIVFNIKQLHNKKGFWQW